MKYMKEVVKNTDIIRIKKLIRLGDKLPITDLRPKMANILSKISMTRQGYDWACCLLVEPRFLKETLEISLPKKWWMTKPEVCVERNGIKMNLDLRDNLQRCIYYTGSYEPETLDFVISNLKKDFVFVDIGAHIGLYSLNVANKLKELGGGQVYSFEPTPDSASKIRANAKNNSLNIEVTEIALGNENCNNKIIYGDNEWGKYDAGVRSFFNTGYEVARVSMKRFDDWNADLRTKRVDMIKIDAEGFEFDIISGMKNTLLELKPTYIIIEIKESVLNMAGKTKEQVLQLLDECGYVTMGKAIDYNQIFVHK